MYRDKKKGYTEAKGRKKRGREGEIKRERKREQNASKTISGRITSQYQ